jgi:hypothetical protein
MQKPDLIKLQKSLTELDKTLKPVYEMIKDMQALKYRTPNEEKELEKLLLLVKEAIPVISTAANFFGNRAFVAAVAYYNSVKQHAEKGDPLAQKILIELAPLYEQALLSQIDKN